MLRLARASAVRPFRCTFTADPNLAPVRGAYTIDVEPFTKYHGAYDFFVRFAADEATTRAMIVTYIPAVRPGLRVENGVAGLDVLYVFGGFLDDALEFTLSPGGHTVVLGYTQSENGRTIVTIACDPYDLDATAPL
jgi:hypothetical protein